jgi:acetamidase/formamidase
MRLQAFGICFSAVVILAATQAQCEEKIHELKASPTTVHRGFFDASLKPVLTIDSGDVVRLWTTTGNPRYFESLGVPKEKIPAELFAAFEGAPGEGRDDHTLDGPIAVSAEIGDTVEIEFDQSSYGCRSRR